MAPRSPGQCWLPIAMLAWLATGCEQAPPTAQRPPAEPTGSSAGVGSTPAPAASTDPATAAGPVLDDAVEAALGASNRCVLSKNGAISCFGDDLIARPVATGSAKQLAVVDGFVCIVSGGGKLACVNAAGGERTELPVYRDGVVMVGGAHTFLVRTEDGVLRGGYIDPAAPQPKPPSGMPGLKDPTAFAAGTTLACGVLDHGVWCWNTEKGHGMPATMAPVPLARGVAVGRERLCVDTEAGEVWCYAADRKAKPTKLEGWSDVTALAMAYGADTRDRLCALTKDGAVRCASLRGEGDTATFDAPKVVPGLSPVARLATGASVSSCAITLSGELWCWGPGHEQPTPVRRGPAAPRPAAPATGG